MTEKLQIYKCEVCGNIVEVLHAGKGQLVCCGQPMTIVKEQTQEQGKEKHLPIVEKTASGIKVKVGSVPHPMEENHYIEWIQVITKEGAWRKPLSPDDTPEAEFTMGKKVDTVREYCSIHGLWKT